MNEYDGGPAFPVIPPLDVGGGSANGYPFPHSGMSLRIYLVAEIVKGFLSNYHQDYAPLVDGKAEIIVDDAFKLADVIIKKGNA